MTKLSSYITIISFLLIPFTVFANSNSLDLEKDSFQYATLASDLSIIGSDNVTFQLWYKPESSPSSGQTYGLFSLGDATSNVQYELNYWNDAGTKKLQIKRRRGNVQSDNTTYTIDLAVNTWYHFVVRYDGTNLELWSALSGETHTQRATVASSGDGTGTYFSERFVVGANDENGSISLYTDGLIDDFRVYDTSLSMTTIDGNFEEELVGNETNLVAYYQFSSNLLDTHVNSYDLTGSGSPTYSTDVPFGGGGGGSSSATSTPSVYLFTHEASSAYAWAIFFSFVVYLVLRVGRYFIA